jgi:hypothetical protein
MRAGQLHSPKGAPERASEVTVETAPYRRLGDPLFRARETAVRTLASAPERFIGMRSVNDKLLVATTRNDGSGERRCSLRDPCECPCHFEKPPLSGSFGEQQTSSMLLRRDRVRDVRRPPTAAHGGTQSHLERGDATSEHPDRFLHTAFTEPAAPSSALHC